MTLALAVAAALLGSLCVYALSGGADFGGGLWDLFARGPRAASQRATIARAIAPIWEANHVWLIVAIVILFVAFPRVFAAISTVLHVPLAVMLVGIVLRGSAFVFRAYGVVSEPWLRRFGVVFAIASAITPIALGVTLGAAARGAVRVTGGQIQGDFVSSWLAPFPLAVGALVLALFAFLAAVYLTLETDEPALRDDFRRRALASALAFGVTAWIALALAARDAPVLWTGLVARPWSAPLQIVTAAVAIGAIAALWTRRLRLARALAIAQVVLVVGGFGLAQYPYVLPPDLTIERAAAPESVLVPMLAALACGGALVLPAFAYLYRVRRRVAGS